VSLLNSIAAQYLHPPSLPTLLFSDSEPVLHEVAQYPLSAILHSQSLENLTLSQHHQQVIFDHALSQIDFLVLLNAATKLLPLQGKLVVIDVMKSKPPPEPKQVIVTPYLIAQARRSGFELIAQKNDENVTGLEFQFQRHSRWTVLPVTAQYKLSMQTLFQQVFGSAMSDAMWDWKYGQQRGMAIGVWQQQELVAHYGGMQRRLSYFGTEQLGIQIGDVMVLPTERGRLTKHGAFFLSASTFAERHVGYASPYLIPYGFPNARHLKVAERLDIYAKVDDVVDIKWDIAQAAKQSPWYQIKAIQKPQYLKTIVDTLWHQMQCELKQQILLTRDWDYIDYRYNQRPDKAYTFLVVYNVLRQPVGLVIIAIEPDMCRFMDYIGCTRHLPRVMAKVCDYLQQQQIEKLSGWFSAAIAKYFIQAGGGVTATEIVLPTIIWSQGIDVKQIKQRWWLTTGDTDFL